MPHKRVTRITEGVIILINVGDLLLRKDVIKAVEEKKFHIYSIKTVDEGIAAFNRITRWRKPGRLVDSKEQ